MCMQLGTDSRTSARDQKTPLPLTKGLEQKQGTVHASCTQHNLRGGQATQAIPLAQLPAPPLPPTLEMPPPCKRLLPPSQDAESGRAEDMGFGAQQVHGATPGRLFTICESVSHQSRGPRNRAPLPVL